MPVWIAGKRIRLGTGMNVEFIAIACHSRMNACNAQIFFAASTGIPTDRGCRDDKFNSIFIQSMGTVTWYEDGIELVVTTAAVSGYSSGGGKKNLGVACIHTRMARNGNKLNVHARSQTYALARDPDGHLLQVP